MKIISSLAALAVAAFLIVWGLGGATAVPSIPTPSPHVTQAQAFTTASFAQQSASDVAQGQLSAAKDPLEAQGSDTEELTDAADTDNVQEGDQSGPDNGVNVKEADNEQDASSARTPATSADAASQVAEAYLNAGTATKIELEDEDGRLVYGVEIGPNDVKVDAMTGAVVRTEDAQD